MSRNQDSRSVRIRTCPPAMIQSNTHPILALVAGAAIFLAVAMISSPVTAQVAKKKIDDITKEFQKRRDAGACKVTAAGYVSIFGAELVVVEGVCPGNSQPVQGVAPKGREQEILKEPLNNLANMAHCGH
jgi:hypothetical protein